MTFRVAKPRRTVVLLVARAGEPGLLGSYGRALVELGADVRYWDLQQRLDGAARLGVLGRRFNAFVPVPPWNARANREFVVAARAASPDVIFVAGTARIEPGALAQIRASLPGTRLVLIWPDTLLNLGPQTIAGLPFYDLVATYSEQSVSSFVRLGAQEVRWIPFAADTVLFPADVSTTAEERRRFACDVVFIGNYRPERERAILALLDSGIDVKVWGGTAWTRRSGAPRRARRYWQGTPILGADFVRATRCARAALNVIDDTNYPAANMRFFETMACRAASLVSSCPEMRSFFPEEAGVVYFDTREQLVSKARALLADEERTRQIAQEGYQRVLAGHTYVHRAREVLSSVGLSLDHGSSHESRS